jgi:hypothetical protein
VRFGDILDLPIVLFSHHDPCNRKHRPHLQPSAAPDFAMIRKAA